MNKKEIIILDPQRRKVQSRRGLLVFRRSTLRNVDWPVAIPRGRRRRIILFDPKRASHLSKDAEQRRGSVHASCKNFFFMDFFAFLTVFLFF